MEEITLSPEQQAAFELLNNSNQNFFVTGKAGTGKSVLLKYFVEHTKKKVTICAPTGIAAIHVGGMTIHSLFGLMLHAQDVRNFRAVNVGLSRRNLLRNIDCLVIDEVSMIRADVMDMIDAKLKNARKNQSPFGGCQIILFGDLYQLPPILGNHAIETFVINRYEGKYFFNAPVVSRSPFSIIELQNVQRQKDEYFISILNRIRLGENSQELLNAINTRLQPIPENKQVITLTARRDKVTEVNESNLSTLGGKEFVYEAIATGEFINDVNRLKNSDGTTDNLPAEYQLKLKIGAQVMMIRNDISQQRRWVNGTVGVVANLTDSSVFVRIGEELYSVDKEQWIKYKYEYIEDKDEIECTEVGTFEQYPIRLAYAMTIHKSQGQTYDGIKIDLSDGSAFEAGQIYVALSRCRSMDSIYLTRALQPSEIRVKAEIKNYLASNQPIQLEICNEQIEHEEIHTSVIPSVSPTTITDDLAPTKPYYNANKNDLSIECLTSQSFLNKLNREPLAHKHYIKALRKERHTPFVDSLIDLIEHEVESYQDYYNELFHGNNNYSDEKERLTERNRIYTQTIITLKNLILCYVSAHLTDT